MYSDSMKYGSNPSKTYQREKTTRKCDWRSDIKSPNSRTLFPIDENDERKRDLVFDKRDFFFPDMRKDIRIQIKLDKTAEYSVTDMRTADKISELIAKLDGLKRDNIVITDGTACIGGNTFSFCKKFKQVQAIELDKKRYNMLRWNLQILGYTNVKCYLGNYLELLNKLTQNVVFLDPPWGGLSYREKSEVELFIGRTPLDEVCEKLKSKTKYVIIKAPTNLNYQKFKAKISGYVKAHYEFRKMLLIVVDYCNQSESKISEDDRYH